MIKKIKSIKNFGVFDDYRASNELPDFQKYNLIYGWNASGKTTLSRLIRCFELQNHHDDFSQAVFKLQIDDKTISNEDLDKYSNIRVFNKDFIDENVFTHEDTIQPIYYLGQENIEQKQKLESLKKESTKKTEQLDIEQQRLVNITTKTEKFSKDKAKQIKDFLRTEGKDKYTNYNKSKFNQNINSFNKEEINKNILKEEELDKKKTAINQMVKDEIQSLLEDSYFKQEDIYFKQEDIEEINKTLKTNVISETIEKLKNNKELNQWVKEGLDLYKQSDKENCQFCEQAIPKNRMEELQKHFSQDYENLMKKINRLKENWETKKIEIPLPDKNALYEDLSQNFQHQKNKLNEQIKKYNQFIEIVLEQLKNKKENPFESITEIQYKTFQVKSLIDDVNKIISQHNKKTGNFNDKRLDDKKSIEKYFLSKSYKEYQNLKIKISDLKISVDKMKGENSKIKKEIEQLSQKRRDYKITAQTINKKLRAFLGREELIFEATNTDDDAGYYIKRASNDQTAKSLSEGEKTAIALIYFLSKLKEENFDLQNGIIVIDDPISSLDSNSVFQAYGFIKKEVKQAKQIFILTHNFDFFKHIKHWFKREYNEKSNKKSEFFMIKNFYEHNIRKAKLILLDNLLKNYDSEYQYLFSLLYRSQNDENDNFKEMYPIPNVARKFMETFLSFKFPSEKNQEEIFSKARKRTNKEFDPEKIETIKRFINTHSHSDITKMTNWDISPWSEGKQVIKDILKLVEELDKEHYEGLVKSYKSKIRQNKEENHNQNL